MTIQVKRVDGDDGDYQLVAENETGQEVALTPSAKQNGVGPSPVELVAMGLGGCSSVDVLAILEKQRQPVERYEVRLHAQRDRENVPAVFTALHLHFIVDGDVAPEKVKRAIDLSLDTYCSVAKMLEKTATITYSYTVNGEEYSASA